MAVVWCRGRLAHGFARRHNEVHPHLRPAVDRHADRSSEWRAHASRIEAPCSCPAPDRFRMCPFRRRRHQPGNQRDRDPGVRRGPEPARASHGGLRLGIGNHPSVGNGASRYERPFRPPSEPGRQRLGPVRGPPQRRRATVPLRRGPAGAWVLVDFEIAAQRSTAPSPSAVEEPTRVTEAGSHASTRAPFARSGRLQATSPPNSSVTHSTSTP